jgi:transposase
MPTLEHHDVTYEGLQYWMCNLFKKLGWMILAHNEGKTKKIDLYLESISHLIQQLEHKIHILVDVDKKTDLEITLKNVKIFQKDVNKLFKKPAPKTRKPRKV